VVVFLEPTTLEPMAICEADIRGLSEPHAVPVDFELSEDMKAAVARLKSSIVIS
jgi:hypothetical protein